jgi:hypothetical protein
MIRSHEPAILDLAVISLHGAIRRIAARHLEGPGELDVTTVRRVRDASRPGGVRARRGRARRGAGRSGRGSIQRERERNGAHLMMSDTSQVIVTTEYYLLHSVHALSVHHRDFPEVRGEGVSPEDAAARLAELLSRAVDSEPSVWCRAILDRAIEDVLAFARGDRFESGGTQ